jgi:hypothetical protein
MVEFGAANQSANPNAAWQDNAPPITTLPASPPAEPENAAPLGAPTAPIAAQQAPGADARRVRSMAIAGVAALLVLVTVVVIALSGSSDSSDKPSGVTPNSASSIASAPPSATATTEPMAPAAASGSALTPDEIAAAVPDETPVVVVPDEPPAPAPSTTQAPKSAWKPIGKGQGRILISAKGGVCKITINSTYYGVTPLDVMVDAGKIRVFCRMSTGATRSKELRVPEFRLTKIEFDVKQ